MKVLTLRYLEDLSSCMKEDPRALAMEKAEARLSMDPLAAELRTKMLQAQQRYAEARRDFGQNEEETRQAQRDFYQAKLALDECPSAKEYSALFSQLNLLYWQLDDLLFHPFREKKVGDLQ